MAGHCLVSVGVAQAGKMNGESCFLENNKSVKSILKKISVLLVWQTSLSLLGGQLSVSNHWVQVRWDEKSGFYEVFCANPGWNFSGKLPSASQPATFHEGGDAIGAYRQVDFEWQDGGMPVRGSIRAYEEKSVMLFSDSCDQARKTAPAPFPDFTRLPSGLHVFSYQQKTFAPPSFQASENSTPWLLFDDRARAVVISPASHFMAASMAGDGRHRVASGFNPRLGNLPPGFSQQTILAFGTGINRAWDLWGQSLNGLRGAQRPGNDADVLLKYFSYWTDNGAAYYYHYDPDKGYAGTLEALIAHDRQEQIPVRCLQLDSWWYFKSFTDAAGKTGQTKEPRLPAGEWNRYGGLLEYRASPFLFPNGLAAFQKNIGLPLATHCRWIDPASPYHQKYKVSGLAAVDPKFWDELAGYMNSCGIVTFEQDWLDRIYDHSPELGSTVDTGETFLREMARACGQRGITLQYCMAYPCHFMEGSRHENLTTIRTSDDRFSPPRWNDFLYTSRLAYSLGIWPWSDVFRSAETNNFILSTLSAGPVGIGDAMGKENKANIFRAVRADGVIVKPDVPLVPLDQCYVTDATREGEALLAGTYTDHAGFRTRYVFAFNRNPTQPKNAQFTPAELGCTGEVCIYDHASDAVVRLPSDQPFKVLLPPDGVDFYMVAPIGHAGIAFFGDRGKFASTGRQRIRQIQDNPDKLIVTVLFAGSEKAIQLHGQAGLKPSVVVRNGTAGEVQFDPATGHFGVWVSVTEAIPFESGSDPVRPVTVEFKADGTAIH
jgi:hypothetical protein